MKATIRTNDRFVPISTLSAPGKLPSKTRGNWAQDLVARLTQRHAETESTIESLHALDIGVRATCCTDSDDDGDAYEEESKKVSKHPSSVKSAGTLSQGKS